MSTNDMPPHEALTRVLGLGERYHVEGLVNFLLTVPAGKGQFRDVHNKLPANLQFHREDVILIERAREAVQLGPDKRLNDEVARLLKESMERSLDGRTPRTSSPFGLSVGYDGVQGYNLTPYYAENLTQEFQGLETMSETERVNWLPYSTIVYGMEDVQEEGEPQTGKAAFRARFHDNVVAELELRLNNHGSVLIHFAVRLADLSESFVHALRTWPRPTFLRVQPRVPVVLGQYFHAGHRSILGFAYSIKVDTSQHVERFFGTVVKRSICKPVTDALRELGIPISDITMELKPCKLGE